MGLELVTRTFRYSLRIRNECQDIVEEAAPSKSEEKTAQRVRARSVGTLTTLGTVSLNDL
jgi:hypothetical protein